MTSVLMRWRVAVGDRVYEAGERAELGQAQAQVFVDLGLAEWAPVGRPAGNAGGVELAVMEGRELAVGSGGRDGRGWVQPGMDGMDGGGV